MIFGHLFWDRKIVQLISFRKNRSIGARSNQQKNQNHVAYAQQHKTDRFSSHYNSTILRSIFPKSWIKKVISKGFFFIRKLETPQNRQLKPIDTHGSNFETLPTLKFILAIQQPSEFNALVDRDSFWLTDA